ncbi:MAG: ATP-binding protein [Clostridiales bacterium]|nr:ATP-binding protein [Clostridiales bacterium]
MFSGGSQGSGVSSISDISCVLLMNACPCGYLFDEEKECKCTPLQIQRYLGRISGPFLDRLDIHIEISRPKFNDLESAPNGESSPVIKKRVEKARLIQQKRIQEHDIDENIINSNSHIPASVVQKICQVTVDGKQMLKHAFSSLNLTARSYNKILKVARTIADLAGQDLIDTEHIAEAIQYRSLERKLWR